MEIQPVRRTLSTLTTAISAALILLSAGLQPIAVQAGVTPQTIAPSRPIKLDTADSPQMATAATDTFDLNSPTVQGAITLDASTPDDVRAGELITYSFAYQNTGGGSATASCWM